MKNETVSTTNHFFNNPTILCVRRFLFSVWHSLLLYQQWDALMILSKSYGPVAVLRTYRDGLAAYLLLLRTNVLESIKEAWTNPRFRIGVGVMCVALPAWRAHTFFDVNVIIEGFYYVNYAFFLNQVKAWVCGVFLSVGAFIALPQKLSFRWFALPVVVLCITQIYEIYNYKHYLDFYQSMPDWQVWAISLCCVPALFLSLNYLVYRKYHLKDGNLARINGILQLDLEAETKVKLLNKLIEERENYNARI